MRISTSVQFGATRIIQSAGLVNTNSIGPSTAFTNLINLGPFTFAGVKTRFTFGATASLSGTTNTLRTGSFRLVEDAAGILGTDIQLPADNAGAGVYKQTVGLQLIRTPTAGVHTYHIQWMTSANATLAVDASNIDHGFAQFSIEELDGVGSNVAPIADECIIDTVQCTDPASLKTAIEKSFARALVIDANMAVVDINLEAGGAGGVMQAVIIYRLPQVGVQTVEYPLVADLAVAVSYGPDRVTNRLSLNKLIGDDPGALLDFWSGASMGDGAVWVQVILYEPGEGEGEGLVAPQSFSAKTFDVMARDSVERANARRGVTVPTKATVSVGPTTPKAERMVQPASPVVVSRRPNVASAQPYAHPLSVPTITKKKEKK